jgi:hypothetical protein
MHRPSAGLPAFLALILAMLALGACTSVRETIPPRSATEQLLISTAVDRAVQQMDLNIPADTKVFVEAGQLDSSDGKYATVAIKERLLRDGANLVAERGKADAIVEVRAGALSIDDRKLLYGTDAFNIPIPFAGQAASVPEFALYREKERVGVAKLAAIGYRTSDGKLIDTTGTQFGYSHEDEQVILFLFTRRTNDLPKEPKSSVLDFD